MPLGQWLQSLRLVRFSNDPLNAKYEIIEIGVVLVRYSNVAAEAAAVGNLGIFQVDDSKGTRPFF